MSEVTDSPKTVHPPCEDEVDKCVQNRSKNAPSKNDTKLVHDSKNITMSTASNLPSAKSENLTSDKIKTMSDETNSAILNPTCKDEPDKCVENMSDNSPLKKDAHQDGQNLSTSMSNNVVSVKTENLTSGKLKTMSDETKSQETLHPTPKDDPEKCVKQMSSDCPLKNDGHQGNENLTPKVPSAESEKSSSDKVGKNDPIVDKNSDFTSLSNLQNESSKIKEPSSNSPNSKPQDKPVNFADFDDAIDELLNFEGNYDKGKSRIEDNKSIKTKDKSIGEEKVPVIEGEITVGIAEKGTGWDDRLVGEWRKTEKEDYLPPPRDNITKNDVLDSLQDDIIVHPSDPLSHTPVVPEPNVSSKINAVSNFQNESTKNKKPSSNSPNSKPQDKPVNFADFDDAIDELLNFEGNYDKGKSSIGDDKYRKTKDKSIVEEKIPVIEEEIRVGKAEKGTGWDDRLIGEWRETEKEDYLPPPRDNITKNDVLDSLQDDIIVQPSDSLSNIPLMSESNVSPKVNAVSNNNTNIVLPSKDFKPSQDVRKKNSQDISEAHRRSVSPDTLQSLPEELFNKRSQDMPVKTSNEETKILDKEMASTQPQTPSHESSKTKEETKYIHPESKNSSMSVTDQTEVNKDRDASYPKMGDSPKILTQNSSKNESSIQTTINSSIRNSNQMDSRGSDFKKNKDEESKLKDNQQKYISGNKNLKDPKHKIENKKQIDQSPKHSEPPNQKSKIAEPVISSQYTEKLSSKCPSNSQKPPLRQELPSNKNKEQSSNKIPSTQSSKQHTNSRIPQKPELKTGSSSVECRKERVPSLLKSKRPEADSGVDEPAIQPKKPPTPNGRGQGRGRRFHSQGRQARSVDASARRTPSSAASTERKLPMNKIEVGKAASPNIGSVKSKIGSLNNSTHTPGGGRVKIESRKIDFTKTTSRIAAKNQNYTPGGGDKKIESKKLNWNVSSRIGSLDNATHKAGGGDKRVESRKLDFKERAQSRVGSKDNLKHKATGGNVQIQSEKLNFKTQASSKVGSLDNVDHKPQGGERKIFDDKEYLKRSAKSSTGSVNSSGRTSGAMSPNAANSPSIQDVDKTEEKNLMN